MTTLPVIVITGPSSVGKSQLLETLSIQYTQTFEIINADSMQVYRGMDIGTAKPKKAQLLATKHHLIDIRDPNDSYSLGDFQQDALGASREILKRNKIPLLSGGTAFYLKHIIDGYLQTPQASEEIKSELANQYKENGIHFLFQKLQKLDPERASQLHSNDTQRIIRSLEIILTSGKRNADFVSQPAISLYDCLCICLIRDRADLINQIELRTEDMFMNGLKDEVEALYSQGFNPANSALKAIGYKEFFKKNEDLSFSLRDDLEAVKKEIKTHTAQYAKRQMTFFRSLTQLKFIHAPVNEIDAKFIDESMSIMFSKIKIWQETSLSG